MARNVQQAGSIEKRSSAGLRPVHALAVVVAGVVGLLVAFWALSFIVGLVWGVVKVAVVVAVIAVLVRLFVGRRR